MVPLYPRTSGDYAILHRGVGFVARGHHGDYDGRGFEPEQSAGSVFVWEKPKAS